MWTTKHQLLFVAEHGHPPWTCFFCGDPVAGLGNTGHIHHIDGDHGNNSILNLAAAHTRCHCRHHNVGRKWTRVSREAASAQRQGKPKSPEHRAAIAAALKGKPKSQEHREAMSRARKGRRPAVEKVESGS